MCTMKTFYMWPLLVNLLLVEHILFYLSGLSSAAFVEIDSVFLLLRGSILYIPLECCWPPWLFSNAFALSEHFFVVDLSIRRRVSASSVRPQPFADCPISLYVAIIFPIYLALSIQDGLNTNSRLSISDSRQISASICCYLSKREDGELSGEGSPFPGFEATLALHQPHRHEILFGIPVRRWHSKTSHYVFDWDCKKYVTA